MQAKYGIGLVMMACLCSFPSIAQGSAAATLKGTYQSAFTIGAAMNDRQIRGDDRRGDGLVVQQFNSISPENALKWEVIHPKPDEYDFSLADQYVRFGTKNHMLIVGHTLCWHSQTPGWVFQDEYGHPLGRDALLKRLQNHIQKVVGRYKGRVASWDVVNEALNEDGTLRQSPWLKIIGEDYIVKAFQYAHEADPAAQLNYNDYNLESPAKRKAAVALVKKVQAAGIPVAVIGDQGHLHLDSFSAATEEKMIEELALAGVKVAVSELDMDVLPSTWGRTADVALHVASNPKYNPYAKGLPDAAQQELAEKYGELFKIFWKHRAVMSRVTFWGVTDGDSWLNDWPIVGRTSYPLLFDREGKTKPAFDAVLRAAQN